jgi:LPXTG-site transpeptidase (sortase) family protein
MLKSFSTQFKNIGEIIAQLVRIFFIIFVIIIFISYWGTVREIFNYKMVYGEILYVIKANISKEIAAKFQTPQINLVPTANANDQPSLNIPASAEKNLSLTIQKIGITAPLLSAKTTDQNDIQRLLTKGVVLYPGSSPIGAEGVSVILGHSAPPGWPKIRYDYIFSKLNDLHAGDQIELSDGNTTYRYEITKKFFLNKGQEIPLVQITNSKAILLLLSCWPPGIDKKRILIQAELQKSPE